MLAVRTVGLAFESLVGMVPNRPQDAKDGDETEGNLSRFVSEAYLELLISIANERFRTNAERIRRFEQHLFKREKGIGQAWEDSKSRQDRKRAEGLEQRQMLRKAGTNQERHDVSVFDMDEDIDDAGLFSSSLTP